MAKLSAMPHVSDRLLVVAFVVLVTLALAVAVSLNTGASFTATTTNPGNHANTLTVQPPASQNAPTSTAGGAVNVSWTATTTAPGTGHSLAYLVLRGPVGGPYAQIASTASLSYSDTPAADGTYAYVIEAQVTGGGSFTSAPTAARSGISDRTAPSLSILCNGAACTTAWYTAAVTVQVSGSDAGVGMGSVTRNVDAGGQVSTSGGSVSFTVSGDSTGHSIQYFGTDAAGNASAIATQTITIDGTAPTAVTGLTSTTGANGSPVTLDLTWTAGTDATSGVQGYEVRWTNAVTGGVCPAANTTNYPNSAAVGAVTSYSIGGLTNNSSYCAYLVTLDNAGNRSASSAATGPTKAK